MSQRRLTALLALVAVVAIPTVAAFWLAASGDDSPDRALVLAPSSLAVVQDELDRALDERGIPTPEWVFAGSQTIVAQLIDGAPADILLTADRVTLDRARDAGVTGPTEVALTENHLVLAVSIGDPGRVDHIDDLADPALLVGVCAVEVPCGRLAADATDALGVAIAADTEEPSARALSGKLLAGELDAGLIYRTDALAGGMPVIDVPGLDDHVTTYWASAVTENDAVLDFLLSADGQVILRDAGFGS